MAAARIKAVHALARVDAFAAVIAAAHDAILLTGHPALTPRSVGCRVEDVRRWDRRARRATLPESFRVPSRTEAQGLDVHELTERCLGHLPA